MYWRVYLPASMLAWGSELRFSRRIIIFALVLGSASSASAWEAMYQFHNSQTVGEYTCSSSTEAASISPSTLAICVDLTILSRSTFVQMLANRPQCLKVRRCFCNRAVYTSKSFENKRNSIHSVSRYLMAGGVRFGYLSSFQS